MMAGEGMWQDWGGAGEGAQTASAGEPSASALGAEIASIEAKFGTPEYIRDEGMQARLRGLYAAQDGGAAPAPREEPLDAQEPTSAEPDSGAGIIELPSAEVWMKAGGDRADFARRLDIARDANDILTGMPEGERIAFGNSFNALPQSVQGAAFAVLGDTTTAAPYPLPEAAVTELSRVPAYAGLIREWGSDAPRKLAVAQERLWRVLDRLNDGEARMAMAWLDRLPKSAMAALVRKMAWQL